MDTVSQVQIAETQMRRSLDLFNQGDYVSAVTLAGAAEEILGKMLESSGEQPAYTSDFKALSKIRAYRGEAAPSGKDVNKLFNAPRNSLKHRAEIETVTLDFRQEAINLLVRCVRNYIAHTKSIDPELMRFLQEHPSVWVWE